MKKKLVEGEDFYYNDLGFMVLTPKFHLERGICCGNGCMHCPFDYKNVAEPKRSKLKAALNSSQGGSFEVQ